MQELIEFIVKSKDGTMYFVITTFKLHSTQSTSHEDIAKTMQHYLESLFLTSDDILERENLLFVKFAIALTMDKFKCSSEIETIEVKRL